MHWQIFLQNVFGGIETGSLYALAALGVVLIYRVSDVTNFAQGEMAMFSTFVTYTIWTYSANAGFAYPYLLAFIGAIIFSAIFGFFVERVFIRPTSNSSLLGKMIVTLGLIMIVNGSAGAIFGTDSYYMPRAIGGHIRISNMIIRPNSFFVIGLALVIMLGLFYTIKFTMFGVAIRATAQNNKVAKLMGIPTQKVTAFTWILATMMGAIAGLMIAPATNVYTGMMAEVHLKSFIAAVLGGFTSFVGPVIGGLMIGVLDNLVGYYISTNWQTVIVYGVLIIILIFKPYGLFGKVPKKKV